MLPAARETVETVPLILRSWSPGWSPVWMRLRVSKGCGSA